MTQPVFVRAPCRLHFGMFSFGQANRTQYGGLGAMIEPPSIEVRIAPAANFKIGGDLSNRAQQIVQQLVRRWQLPTMPHCHVNINSPINHTGLGVGTQLHLAIATALRHFLELPPLSIKELSTTSGRGRRSAVGTYGFQHGGFIVDGGKQPGASLGKLTARAMLPEKWRFTLFCDPLNRGLSGPSEALAFDQLPDVPESVTQRLWAITNEQVLPAIEHQDYQQFGIALYEFGRLAGECFANAQGGPFASPRIELLIEAIRGFGVAGAGQSSWGPTVFAITANDEEAERLIELVQDKYANAPYDVTIAKPNNHGAIVKLIGTEQ